MDALLLKRHLPSIEEGRWVDRKELPSLLDLRVLVRGHSSKIVRDLYASKERVLGPDDMEGTRVKQEVQKRITREVLSEATLMDITGLVLGGEQATVSVVRELLLDPAFEPLCDLIAAASFRVSETREAHQEAIKGNS